MNDTWRDRAKGLMKEKGITQNALSELLDMTQGGLQHWLAGSRQPTLADINRIADALGTPRAWLTHGIEPNDTVHGLHLSRQAVLRKLIQMERAQPLPDTFWAAISAMAATVAPSAIQPEATSPPTSSRNGTEG